jgi:hypothetical protein
MPYTHQLSCEKEGMMAIEKIEKMLGFAESKACTSIWFMQRLTKYSRNKGGCSPKVLPAMPVKMQKGILTIRPSILFSPGS